MLLYRFCPNCNSELTVDILVLVSMSIDEDGRPLKVRCSYSDIEHRAKEEYAGCYYCCTCSWQENYIEDENEEVWEKENEQ